MRRSRIDTTSLRDTLGILPQRRQPVGGPCGNGHVVEADDRDVVGHAQACFAQVIERAERHEIVHAEERIGRRPACQQPARRLSSAVVVGVTGAHDTRLEPGRGGKPGEGLLAGGQARARIRLVDHGEAGGPGQGQGLECLLRAVHVVAMDAVEAGLGAVYQDQRLPVSARELDKAFRRRTGKEDGRLRPVAQQLPAGVRNVFRGGADVDDRRHVAALDQAPVTARRSSAPGTGNRHRRSRARPAGCDWREARGRDR